MEKTKKKSLLTLRRILMACGLIPILLSSVITVLYSSDKFHSIMYEYRMAQLKSVALATKMSVEKAGGMDDARNYLDTLSNYTGMEMTIIHGSKRAITTLKDSNGNYLTGTDIDFNILNVLKTGQTYESYDTVINDKQYLVHYTPIMLDDEYVGAIFTGYNKAVTESQVRVVIYVFINVMVLICIIFIITTMIIAKMISKDLIRLVTNLNYIEEGNLVKVEKTRQFIREFINIDQNLLSLNTKMSQIMGDVISSAKTLDDITEEVSQKCTLINQGVSDISTATAEVSNGTVNLTDSIQKMNSDIINIGEDIDVIRDKVKDVHHSTSNASETSINLVNDLGKLIKANGETKEYTNDVVKSINETAAAIDQIGNAATLIESIADQTNLLSLNASIEAARAGDAGRGFAVVATEIKNLAEQSAKSANDVQSIIKTIVEKSNRSTVSANAISNAVDSEMNILHVVRDGVSDINSKVVNINDDMNYVENTITNINAKKVELIDNITNLSSISEENAAMIEETNATIDGIDSNMDVIDKQSREVADQATLLVEMTKFFNL